MKKLALLIFIGIYSISTFGQEKPKPINFASYNERQLDFNAIISKTEQFLFRLSNEPKTTKGVIVVFPRLEWIDDCIDGRIRGNPEIEHFVRNVVSLDTTHSMERVEFLTGNITNRDQVQYWLIPEGAANPSADTDSDLPCCCPPLLIVGKPTVSDKATTVKFFAWMGESKSLADAKYNWKVSQGKITSGQGTSHIEVDIRGLTSSSVTASVEIVGLNPFCGCQTSTTYTTSINRWSWLIVLSHLRSRSERHPDSRPLEWLLDIPQ